jgi:hypothetical protein
MDFVQVSSREIVFRLGVEFRLPTDPISLESLLPARHLRVQVAWPPPDRVDGSSWSDGLWVRDGSSTGRRFNPQDLGWRDPNGGVFPVDGTSPLGQPAPETLVYDGWVTASVVPPAEALARCFDLIPSDKAVDRPLDHFISVSYPTPPIGGQPLGLAGVNYYCEGVLPLLRPVDGYFALCLGVFYPRERDSAEYIVFVDPFGEGAGRSTLSAASTSEEQAQADPVIFPVVPAY